MLVPPSLTLQPSNQIVLAGATVNFSAAATGTAPLNYQWQFNGTNLNGAVAETLILTNIQPAQAGSYSVLVTNSAGSITSAVAVLTVATPPLLLNARTATNGAFAFTLSGVAGLIYAIEFTTNFQKWTFLTLLTNTTGQVDFIDVTSSNAVSRFYRARLAYWTALTPPEMTKQPTNQTVSVGGTANFSAAATGTAPLNYQWQFNGTDLDGAVSQTLSLTNVQPAQAGDYKVVASNAGGSATSVVAVLTVQVPPSLTLQPSNQIVLAGATVNFSVVATGTAPLEYQWQFNGAPLGGAVAETLILTNIQPAQAGSYSVLVTNSAGSITSAVAVLTVATPPLLLNARTATNGAFAFTLSGVAGLIYAIEFTTNFQKWTFLALLTNTTGQVDFIDVTSSNAVSRFYRARLAYWTALTPPEMTKQPTNQTVPVGGTANFSAEATCTAPLNYQWQFNGTSLNGASSETLILTNVQPARAGSYRVLVNNCAGSVTSAVAVLTVATPPLLLKARTATNGTFAFTLSGVTGLVYAIEVTTNLQQWAPLASLTNTTGQTDFTDAASSNSVSRFYRARLAR